MHDLESTWLEAQSIGELLGCRCDARIAMSLRRIASLELHRSSGLWGADVTIVPRYRLFVFLIAACS